MREGGGGLNLQSWFGGCRSCLSDVAGAQPSSGSAPTTGRAIAWQTGQSEGALSMVAQSQLELGRSGTTARRFWTLLTSAGAR